MFPVNQLFCHVCSVSALIKRRRGGKNTWKRVPPGWAAAAI